MVLAASKLRLTPSTCTLSLTLAAAAALALALAFACCREVGITADDAPTGAAAVAEVAAAVCAEGTGAGFFAASEEPVPVPRLRRFFREWIGVPGATRRSLASRTLRASTCRKRIAEADDERTTSRSMRWEGKRKNGCFSVCR